MPAEQPVGECGGAARAVRQMKLLDPIATQALFHLRVPPQIVGNFLRHKVSLIEHADADADAFLDLVA